MNRIVRIALFAGLSSLALASSAAYAKGHDTGDARPASWDRGEGEHWHDHRDEHRDRRFDWERRAAERREERQREWLRHHRFEDYGEWRR
jgi:hypothetical protein